VAGPRRSPGSAREELRARRAGTTELEPVYEAAARFLQVRARSVDEVRRRLTQAGYPPALIEAALERLSGLGYLDDAAFARAWVESRDRARPRGEAALRRELRQRGVAPELVAEVLAGRAAAPSSVAAGDDAVAEQVPYPGAAASEPVASADERAARRALERSAAALRREPDPGRRRRRAYAMLARRGFDPAVCGAVVASWLADEALAGTDEEQDPVV